VYRLAIEILQVVASTDRRGTEVSAVELGIELAARGHRLRTVALAPGTDEARIGVATLGPKPLAGTTVGALRAAAGDVDVVVAHGPGTLPACGMALLGATPFAFRSIGDPGQWSASGLRRVRTRMLLTRAAAVVAITGRAADTFHDLHHVPADRLWVIPNGASAARHRPASPDERATARLALGLGPDEPVVATIGALTREKDVELAIEAVSRLQGVHLVVTGDGPERTRVHDLSADVPGGRVILTGALDDPSSTFAAADVVLLTSRTEGQASVLVEAGLRGLPAVTTDVGYVRDIVLDGETGIVVTTRDPVAISVGIERALADRRRLGDAARGHCRREFELTDVVARWEAVLESVRRA
jgi:glycosyltransferase involved in cell wall biosynthesis